MDEHDNSQNLEKQPELPDVQTSGSVGGSQARTGRTRGEQALAYAALGLRVFPVNTMTPHGCSCGRGDGCDSPGKHPAGRLAPRGCRDATNDPAQIKRWWSGGTDWNVGIATGDGLMVVDCDGLEGVENFSRLADANGGVPVTAVARTGGGLHLFFRLNPGQQIPNSQGVIVRRVDVRGEGGYVVAPPSVHHTGALYEWVRSPEQMPLAECPEWLDAAAKPEAEVPADLPEWTEPGADRPDWMKPGAGDPNGAPDRWVDRAVKRVQGGKGRNDTGHWLAGQLRDDRIDIRVAEATVRRFVGAVRDQGTHPYTEDEAIESLKNAYRRPPRAPAADPSYQARGKGRPAGPVKAAGGAAADSLIGLVMTCMADVEPESVSWLWRGRIALGKITLLAGDPGLGKSYITLDWAAHVTTGAPWPDAPADPQPVGSVILVNAEDGNADTIRPRLDRLGADVSRVHTIDGVRRPGRDGASRVCGFTLADIPALEQAIAATPDCRLVVIDPVSAFLNDRDSHSNAEVRGLLAPVAKLAADYRVAVVMVTHLSKSGGSRAMYRSMGSLAFAAAARAAWLVVKDRDDERRRLLLPTKNNLADDTAGMAYRLDDGAVVWEREPVTMRADDALAAVEEVSARRPGPKPEALDQASAWLRELLAAGPMPSAKVKAEAAGVAWRTVRRAQEHLGIKPERDRFTGVWAWRLPAGPPGHLSNAVADAPGVNDLDNLDNISFPADSGGFSGPQPPSCPSPRNVDTRPPDGRSERGAA